MEDKFLKLKEIANWQLGTDSKVKLPPLQRSFVWKPQQIETLWDSILRGFPIGSLLLTKAQNDELYLIDGQQRATSIALGFYNPWEFGEQQFFDKRIKDATPTVWLDLQPKEITDSHKYVIRVLTKSHPWGYSRKKNASILPISRRQNFLKKIKEWKDTDFKYTDLSNIEVFPEDADLPVPLAFFISFSENNDKNKFLNSCFKLPYYNDQSKKNSLSGLVNQDIFDEFSEKIRNKFLNYQIPTLVTSKEIINETDEKEEKGSEDPTLFIRLNREGTRIDGEELIYSIYKAEFPAAKDLVEDVSLDFIKPSQLISIFSRLAWSQINDFIYPNKISVNDFRKRIRDNRVFKSKLEKIGDIFKPLSDNAIKILCSPEGFMIPKILIKIIISNSPELFLALLYWISKNPNINENTSINIKKKILKLYFFGFDIEKFVKNIWFEIANEDFWSEDNFNKYCEEGEFIFRLPKPSEIKNNLQQFIENSYLRWWEFTEQIHPESFCNFLDYKDFDEEKKKNCYKSYWKKIFGSLAWNRNLLLLLQRNYLENNFKEFNSLEVINDTNRPWDWDHIYPTSWVYNKKNIDNQIRDFHNFNCNLRAISLQENRSESNHLPPSQRFEDDQKKEDYFIKNDWEFWQFVNGKVENQEIKKIKMLMKAFITRKGNLYEEIYNLIEK